MRFLPWPRVFLFDSCFTVVQDPSVGTPIRVPSVATPGAPSTEYRYMKCNTNNIILILILTLTLNRNLKANANLYLTLTLADPSDTTLYAPFS